VAGLESIVKKVVTSSARVELYLNVQKTKVLTTAGITSFKVNNEDIEVVQQFKLLGSSIGGDGGCRMEVLRRLSLGRAVMNGLTTIWKTKISVQLRRRDLCVHWFSLLLCTNVRHGQ